MSSELDRSLQIRPARLEDAASISALILSASGDFCSPVDGRIPAWFVASVSPQSIAGYLVDPAYHYLVAEFGEALAGIIAVHERSYVFHLFVSPDYQRRGVATRLWERAKTEALAAGNTGGFQVRSSLLAVPLYARFGFVITGERAEKNGIAYVPMFLKPEQAA